ncbi:MAG TPA: FtsX-like permease family protein [Streptosporangiaceae bacterium]|nr:FtsX-like permease family protein [Streptosporangiaceae bacterium]
MRSSILWPRMRSVWPLLVSVLLSTLIASSLVAAFAGFGATALPQAVSSELIVAPHKSIVISGAISAQQERNDHGVVSATIARAFGGIPFTVADGIWSDPLGLPASKGANIVPIAQAAAMDQIRPHVQLTAGTWPTSETKSSSANSSSAKHGIVEAAIPATVAADLHLTVGQVVPLRDRASGKKIKIAITGLFRPLNASDPYWGLDLLPTAGISEAPGFITYGPFVVSPRAFTAGLIPIGGATWLYGLGSTKLTATQLNPLASRVTRALGQLSRDASLGGLQTASGLPGILDVVSTKLVVARSLLLVGELELLLLAGAALSLTARTLAAQREEESAIFGSRGAGRRQLVAMALAEALVVTTIAAAAGALLGSRLAGLLARIGALKAAGLKITGIATDDWWTVGAVLLLCTAILVWPSLRSVSPGMLAVRRGRRTAVLLAASAGMDLALVVLAGLAAWQLRQFSVLGRTPGGLGVDPVLAVAPAVALAAGTVLPLRLLPMLARAGDRLAARTRRLGSAMTSWELSRRATRQSAPMLLVVLAVGTSTLALAQHQSWRQSAFDQSAFLVGADVRAETALPATPETAGQIAGARGVTSAMAVSTGLTGPNSAAVLAVDSRQAPDTALFNGDQIAPDLWHRIAARGSGQLVTLPGRPVRLGITASLDQGKGPSLAPVTLTAAVADNSGNLFQLPLGSLPPDGHPHRLTAQLTSTGQADYPLRLYAITASYTLPQFVNGPRAKAAAKRAASFAITGLATSQARRGPVTTIPITELDQWEPSASAPLFTENGVGSLPRLITKPGSGLSLVNFNPGHGLSLAPFQVVGSPTAVTAITGLVALRALPPARVLPAIATASFLRLNQLKVGSDVQLTAGQTPLTAVIVGETNAFPTVTGTGGGLIVDLAAAQEMVTAVGQPPIPVTQWWLATKTSQAPPGLPVRTSVIDRAVMAAQLLADPMSAIPQQAVVATAIAAALLAALGFSVAVAGSVRERRNQAALLAALGVDGRAQARLLCLEAASLSVPAAITGLLLGTVLAHLLVPAVTLTAAAATPVVPVLVKVPVTSAALIALIVTAIPVLAAAASAVYRPDPAAQLRMAAS